MYNHLYDVYCIQWNLRLSYVSPNNEDLILKLLNSCYPIFRDRFNNFIQLTWIDAFFPQLKLTNWNFSSQYPKHEQGSLSFRIVESSRSLSCSVRVRLAFSFPFLLFCSYGSAYSDEFRPALKTVRSSNHWRWAHGTSVDTLKTEQRSCLTFPRLISHHLTLPWWLNHAQLVGGWTHTISLWVSRPFDAFIGRWTEMASCIPRLLLLGRVAFVRSFREKCYSLNW